MYQATKAWQYLTLKNNDGEVVRIHIFRSGTREYNVGYSFDKEQPLSYDHVNLFAHDWCKSKASAKGYVDFYTAHFKQDGFEIVE